MKLFVVTTSIETIRAAHSLGIIDGVIADRSQIGGGPLALERRMNEVCQVMDGPVVVDVAAAETSEIVKEARGLASRDTNAVISVPLTPDALRAVRRLSDEGVRICVGPVRTLAQGLLAAKSGAEYIGVPAGDLVEDVVRMITTYGLQTEVIVVGVNGPDDILAAMRAGAHAIAASFETIEQLFQDA